MPQEPSSKFPLVSTVQLDPNPLVFSQFLRCSSPEARARVPFRFAREYTCLPLGLHQAADSEFLSVLLPEEASEELIANLRFICGCEVVTSTGPVAILGQAIAVLYAKDDCQLIHTNTSPKNSLNQDDSIVRFSRLAILQAISLRSSDLHIDCAKYQTRLRFRIRGELTELSDFKLQFADCEKLCRHLKVLAKLDSNPSIAQEGVLELSGLELLVRIRISTVPTARGEKIVLRFLQNGLLEELANQPFGQQLASLGLFAEQRQIILNYLRAERGALLVSGPTGSGKSTLLYVLLHQLCNDQANVVTIEDPVEAQIDNACQIDIAGMDCSFEEMLAKVLRQNPDSLLVGEIRTKAAAQAALQAAIAGTKVLSGIHAGSCFEVIARLAELGISETLLGLAVHTVSAQRLLPRNCQYCAENVSAAPNIRLIFQLKEATTLKRSTGCSRCLEGGRVAVYEFLPLSEALTSILRKKDNDYLKDFAKQAYSEGYRSYGFYVHELLLAQIISPEVARKAIGV